jgi:hypothetical protein
VQVVQHLLLPLRSGFVPLPRFMVTAKRYDTDIALAQALRNVFVRPAAALSSTSLVSPFAAADPSVQQQRSGPTTSISTASQLLSSSPSLHSTPTLITL